MTKILAVALGTLMMVAIVPAAGYAQASTAPASVTAYGYYYGGYGPNYGPYYDPYFGYGCYGPHYLWYGPCPYYPSYGFGFGFGFGDRDFHHNRDFHGWDRGDGFHDRGHGGGFHGGHGGGRR
jgi:hypothetical protein